MEENQQSVLFVCLGNICRSPMAEALFIQKITERGLLEKFHVDSCGVGDWHVGHDPDPRTIDVCTRNGVPIRSKARQIRPSDLEEFDHIVVMDRSNYRSVQQMDNHFSDKVVMMRLYDGNSSQQDVPDPYFGGRDGFDNVFQLLDEATENLLNTLSSK